MILMTLSTVLLTLADAYTVGGLIMFVIFLWGLARVTWPPRDDDD
jgi:hypothetical protein